MDEGEIIVEQLLVEVVVGVIGGTASVRGVVGCVPISCEDEVLEGVVVNGGLYVGVDAVPFLVSLQGM